MEREIRNALADHGHDPTYEIEVRFGWITGSTFSPDMGESFHEDIQNYLFDRFTRWTSVSVEGYTTVTKNAVRSTYTNSTGRHESTVRKTLVSNADIRAHGTPFDVRVSVKRENPVHNYAIALDDPDAFKRVIHRVSWIHETGTMRFDLSRVDNKFYELEIEILRQNFVNIDYLTRLVTSEVTNLILVPPEDSHLKGFEVVKRTSTRTER